MQSLKLKLRLKMKVTCDSCTSAQSGQKQWQMTSDGNEP